MTTNPPLTTAIACRLRRHAILAAMLGLTTIAAYPTTASAGTSPSAAGTQVSRTPVALAAQRTTLVENATLHLTGEGESTLEERGRATGTFNAPLTASLTLSVGHVTGIFTISPKGGSVTGKAQARYVLRGSIGYYGGTLTITHGTGIYRHASGSNIGISGTINHLNFALTVKAHGWINL